MITINCDKFMSRQSSDDWRHGEIGEVIHTILDVAATVNITPYIAGGAIRRLVREGPTASLNGGDIDLFFKSMTDKDNMVKRFEEEKFVLEKTTAHHTQFTATIDDKPVKIQLIHFAYFDSVGELLDAFDFTITQFALLEGMLYMGDLSLWDLARNRLIAQKITFPLSSMRRVLKYANQGFTVCDGTLSTILKTPLDHPETLKQLDVAYID